MLLCGQEHLTADVVLLTAQVRVLWPGGVVRVEGGGRDELVGFVPP